MRPGKVGRAKHGGVQQSNASASNGSARNGQDDVQVITSEVQGQEADGWSMLEGLHPRHFRITISVGIYEEVDESCIIHDSICHQMYERDIYHSTFTRKASYSPVT